jgi:nitrite reductase/ring-hydroxylating ferredoxin subunit/uncharacterized membrane protein
VIARSYRFTPLRLRGEEQLLGIPKITNPGADLMTEVALKSGTLTRAVESSMERMTPVKALGETVSQRVHDAVMEGGEPTRRVADTLHGTWLGHPLHPVLTDVTIGAWVLGAAFDAIGETTGDDLSRLIADRLLLIGTVSAAPTAVTGLIDYSTTPKPAITAGTLHALLNYVGVGLYAVSLWDRRRGRRGRGVLLSSLALGVTSASAWLGGHLVYRHKVGVDHAERFDGPEEWTAILDEAELEPNRPRCVEYEGKKILLHRDGGRLYAIGAVCSHAAGPLHEGEIDGHLVQCPWHDTVFDLRDGSIAHGPATQPQNAFDVRVRDARIEIRLQRA